MDMALCSLRNNKESSSLKFAGANNPVWIIRKDAVRVEELKGDKFPIGMFVGEELHHFRDQETELYPGDMVYIFTDGYADQFGGDKGKKFKYKPLQELLLGIRHKSMDEQRDILDTTITGWRGELEQVDDILIIGVKIT
jgi:serine phosphatase RsbU (regulator of sigma subunit)